MRIREPERQYDHAPSHAAGAHVMETLVEPASPLYLYQAGQYVYVHQHAYETNALAAQECLILDTTNAPLEIVVQPCNSDDSFVVAQDKLSAPIIV